MTRARADRGHDPVGDDETWHWIAEAHVLYERYIDLARATHLPALEDEPLPSVPTMDTPLGIVVRDPGEPSAFLE